MKSAREMFEELEWRMFKDTFDIIAFRYTSTLSIYFYKKDKCFRIYEVFGQFVIDVPLMKAIQKQCEELGWLE